MTAPLVLIAAWSGRMLAASARRAGYTPLVADAFGDDDTRALAAGFQHLPSAFPRGFQTPSLVAALERLVADAGAQPLGLLLGAGFEHDPDLIAALAARWPLLGCSANSVRHAKDPRKLFPLLRDLGITHPETRLNAPSDPAGWLIRRVGGSGGTHIREADTRLAPRGDVYYQRRLIGRPVSLSGVVGRRRDAALSFTHQWTQPTAGKPYRFGGAAGPVALDPDLEARMIDDALSLANALDLVGLVSFDFLSLDGAPVLLEINPRPSATLDIQDNADGVMFKAHLAAVQGDELVSDVVKRGGAQPEGVRAFAYLYADEGSVRVANGFAWPEWSADRSPAGRLVPAGAPLATVLADGPDARAAVTALHERSRQLQTMLYAAQNAQQKTTEDAP